MELAPSAQRYSLNKTSITGHSPAYLIPLNSILEKHYQKEMTQRTQRKSYQRSYQISNNLMKHLKGFPILIKVRAKI